MENFKRLNSSQNLHHRHRLSFELIEKLNGEKFPKQKTLEKMKSLSLVGHFIKITDLLRHNNIWFASIKGPLLSYRIYSDATTRSSRDIDILIRPEDVNKVRLLVLNNHYKTIKNDWPEKESQQKKFMKLQKHISFYDESGKILFEFHWRLSSQGPTSHNLYETQLSKSFTEIIFMNKPFVVLTKEYELMYLILHGSVDGWFRLKWLVDILHYPTEDIDKTHFLYLIKTNKLNRAVALTSALLKLYFNKTFFINEPKYASKTLVNFCRERIESEQVQYVGNKDIIKTEMYLAQLMPSFYNWKRILASFFIRKDDLIEFNYKYMWAYYLIRPYSFIKRRILNK